MVELTPQVSYEQLWEHYCKLKGAVRSLEVTLGVSAETLNRDEARAMRNLRRLGIPIGDVVEREKKRLATRRR